MRTAEDDRVFCWVTGNIGGAMCIIRRELLTGEEMPIIVDSYIERKGQVPIPQTTLEGIG